MNEDFDFFEGMKVIVSIPEGEDLNDYNIFNAGWDDDMYDYVGKIGVVKRGPSDPNIGTGFDYLIRFDDGNTWWWDERYIRPADAAAAEQVPPIEESDFAEILS